MSFQERHDLTDTDRVSPDVRVCRQLLRELLARGVTTVELVGAGSLPSVNRLLDGIWQPYMQIPAQTFAPVVRQLKRMADLEADQAHGTIRARFAGRDTEIALTTERIGDRVDILTMRLQAAPAAA